MAKQPTDKMLDTVEKIINTLAISISEDEKNDFNKCKNFIGKNISQAISVWEASKKIRSNSRQERYQEEKYWQEMFPRKKDDYYESDNEYEHGIYCKDDM